MLDVPDFNKETGNFNWDKFIEKRKEDKKKDKVGQKVDEIMTGISD